MDFKKQRLLQKKHRHSHRIVVVVVYLLEFPVQSFHIWFGLVWFDVISTIVGYLMPNSFLYIKTVLFQTIQFCISTQFRSTWLMYRTLSGATTLGYNRPGSHCNKGVLCIPKSSSISGTSLSDCLVSYLGHTLRWGVSYLAAEMQLDYSTADWTRIFSRGRNYI